MGTPRDDGRRVRSGPEDHSDDTDWFDRGASDHASGRQQVDEECPSTLRALSSRGSSLVFGRCHTEALLWLNFATQSPTLEQAVAAERLVLAFGEKLRESPPESQTSSAWLQFLRTLVATLNSKD